MRDRIIFYLNGVRQTVDANAGLLTLSDYLRHGPNGDRRLTGTKIACAEGDCGACTVLVGDLSEERNAIQYRSVDACIAFVFQMDGRHVVTVEGLERSGGLTDIQEAMVRCHGSQCGFCTPGFVMAMHSLAEAKRVERDPSTTSGGTPSDCDVRVGLSGNLCRCTGYQQILLAAAEANLPNVAELSSYFDSDQLLGDLLPLQRESVLTHSLDGQQRLSVAIPRSLEDLVNFRTQLPHARLVAGATDLGVQRNHGKFLPQEVISLGQLESLQRVEVDDSGELIIGASATWQAIDAEVSEHLPEYHQVLLRFGSPQVRHAGTLAGNLANASPIADSTPFHLVAESTIEAISSTGSREIPINEFYLGYKEIDLRPDEVITRVRTPLPGQHTAVKLYKISKRRDMDISTVTAAFWLELEQEKIAEARIAVGGVGPIVQRLRRVEEVLRGRDFTLPVMEEAGLIAREEIQPISDVRASAEYRLQVVQNLFAKCHYDLSTQPLSSVT